MKFFNGKVKILATIGPSSMDVSVFKKMVQNGLSAVRINTSHGQIKQYDRIISMVRNVKEDMPIILDTQGPEIRIYCQNDMKFKEGEKFELHFCEGKNYYFNFDFQKKIRKGDLIIVDEGIIQLEIEEIYDDSILVKSLTEGKIRHGIRVNIPGRIVTTNIFSKADRKIIQYGVKKGIDYLALSYTNSASDVRKAMKFVNNDSVDIIAKIETEQGVKNFNEILEASSGIMVARGDLGVEIPSEKLPLLQKQMILKCNQSGKVVITATQMLQSMIENEVPTRAETSDVANAVLDGTDVVMLSGETASGKHPASSVKEMKKIALEVEPHVQHNFSVSKTEKFEEALSKSIFEATNILPISKILCITETGKIVKLLSRFKVKVPIIAVTSSQIVLRKLTLFYGVYPIYNQNIENREDMFKVIASFLKKKILSEKDLLLITLSTMQKKNKRTNAMEFHYVNEMIKKK